MAYDEGLAYRIREFLADESSISERKMFGGLAIMINGNMLCGPVQDGLLVRVSPDTYEAALQEPGVSVMDMTGRPMRGFVLVSESALAEDAELNAWVGRGLKYAKSLPPK